MSRWFRHYAGMMRDDKLVRVAIRSKQPIERVAWVWGAILESAAEIDADGRYDFDAAEAAYFLRADEDELLAVVGALEDAGRLAKGSVVKWGDRQFSSDRSAERQRRYRERKREDIGDGQPPEQGRNGNGGVTSLSRHGDAPETETELETEKDNSEANASGAVAPVGPTAIDLKAAVFNSGVALLVAAGSNERNARSMIGRWCKDHGTPATLDALAAATASTVPDPIPWIQKRFANGRVSNTLRGARPDPSLDFLRQADADLEAERRSASDRRGIGASLPAVRAN